MSLDINLADNKNMEKILRQNRCYTEQRYHIVEGSKNDYIEDVKDFFYSALKKVRAILNSALMDVKHYLGIESEKEKWARKVPEINWDAQITSDTNFNATAQANDKKGEVLYSKTCTTYSGCDTVVIINGKCIGTLHSYDYEVDGEKHGDIRLTAVLFDKTPLFLPEGSLMIATFENEYGNKSMQVFRIGKMKKYYTGASIDEVVFEEQAVYECDLIVPHTQISDTVTEMPKEVFEDMVANVYANCTEKSYLPEDANPRNSLTHRAYFYYLYKNYCDKRGQA